MLNIFIGTKNKINKMVFVLFMTVITNSAMAKMPARPIGYIEVKTQPISLIDEMPGRTVASYRAEVRPQVSGIIIKKLFAEGGFVKKGQPLYQIDPAQYKANLKIAKANLKSAKAHQISSRSKYTRYKNLLTKKVISKQDFDDVHASFLAAQAGVDLALANVDIAQINLNYTTIKSPINGRIGRSFVTAGALVTANQANNLATVQAFNPMYVDLVSTTNDLLEFRKALNNGKYKKKHKLDDIKLILEDGTSYEQLGTFMFSDVNVNKSTGSFILRIAFENPDEMLLPGMFVRAKMPRGVIEKGILIPVKALMRDPKGMAQVYILNNENKVELRHIKTGNVQNNSWVVLDGLKVGEKVIVQGLQFVRPGATLSNSFNLDAKH